MRGDRHSHVEWGETVHAVVMRKPGAAVTGEEIVAFCKERIAHYKCPRSVRVQEEPLPMSGAGKILKHGLQPLWKSRERPRKPDRSHGFGIDAPEKARRLPHGLGPPPLFVFTISTRTGDLPYALTW